MLLPAATLPVNAELFQGLLGAMEANSGSVQCTKTSDSSRSITPGAGLTWEETKGPLSEQQEQFTAPDAAIITGGTWRTPVHHTAVPVAYISLINLLKASLVYAADSAESHSTWGNAVSRTMGFGYHKRGSILLSGFYSNCQHHKSITRVTLS
eukprot:Em0529g2a